MAMEDKVEAIKKIGGSSTGAEKVTKVANRDYFESLMLQQQQHQQQQTKSQEVEAAANSKKPTLMDQVADLNRKVENVKKIQPPDIVAQAQEVIARMSEIKEQLALPDQSIKPAYRNLLKNKLTHIDENLKIALSAAGVENVPPLSAATTNNPIDRFLGFLTHGQAQLQTIAKEVETMHLNKNNLNAASMLAVQIKIGFVQQELEFFSSVLNKALESTKTIMNVQV